MPAAKTATKKASLSSKPYRTIKFSGQTGTVSRKRAAMAVRKVMADKVARSATPAVFCKVKTAKVKAAKKLQFGRY